MTSGRHIAALCALAAFGVALEGGARAAEIIVFANQGATTAVRDLAPAFEAASGHKVVVKALAGVAMNEAIAKNEPGDVVSSLLEQFDELVARGKVAPGSWKEYARAANGVAVKAGARKWNISTPDGFKRAMLEANSIGHSGNGTGPFNTKLFQRLGIYDEVKGKIKIIEGGVANAVARGEVEIGIQQTNVIQPLEGTVYLGALPTELLEYGRFGVGVLTVAKQPDIARAFVAFATSPQAAPFIRKSTMDIPSR